MATNPDSANRARAAQTARLAKEAKTRRAIVAGSLASFVAALGLVSLTGSPATTGAEPAPVIQVQEQPAARPNDPPQDEEPIISWQWGDDDGEGDGSHDEGWGSWGEDDDKGEGNDDDAWIIGDAPSLPQWGNGGQQDNGSIQQPQPRRRAHARTRSS